MLNAENTQQLFHLAADLLSKQSGSLAVVDAVNDSNEMGLSVAAATLNNKGVITLQVGRNRTNDDVSAALDIQLGKKRYIAEVNPASTSRMERHFPNDIYASTRYDSEVRYIYTNHHENNVSPNHGDSAAVGLFTSIVALGLAKIDTSKQGALTELRAAKRSNQGVQLFQAEEKRDKTLVATFSTTELTKVLGLFQLFNLTSVTSGDRLPRT